MEYLRKPIVMTAMIGEVDFSWVNGLRQKHYPPEKNKLPAHITLFHHLPPQGLDEIVALVRKASQNLSCPQCTLADLIRFDEGVAFKLHSPQLLDLRQFLAESLHGLLVQQDQHKPRFHITIQNKATPQDSKRLFNKLNDTFEPRPIEIVGLSLFYYLGGPWRKIADWRFRGSSKSF